MRSEYCQIVKLSTLYINSQKHILHLPDNQLKSLSIMRLFYWSIFFCLFFCAVSLQTVAQEEHTTIQQGRKYLDINIHALDKYSNRLKHQQERLIKKLKRKEHRFAKRLMGKDSAAYASYKDQNLTYDSIGKLLHPDSATLAGKFKRRSNDEIDSLKAVQSFLQNKSASLDGNSSQLQGYSPELTKLNSELNYRKYINDLISQRTSNLKNLGGISNGGNIPVLTGIEKQVFYGKAKMKAYKDMADDPSKAEDKALEYLEGRPGFDKYMDKAGAGDGKSMQSLSPDATSADMENMGFQTKQQMQAGLNQKLGKDMGGFSTQMSKGVKIFQDGAGDINKTKQGLKGIRNIDKPSFKINPMRGLPFWKRIEKQYNWQTTRATLDGKPALLEVSAMAGFKQSPKLSYGLGIATAIGLGQSWSNIRFTWQGLGLRSYAAWQWQYGIGAYAGYERMYKQFAFTGDNAKATELTPSVHNAARWSESVLLGLTKKYNINTKWNGAIQVLYDIWWQQKGLRSPIVLRFTTQTK